LSRSPWRSFHPWLHEYATPLDLPEPGNASRIALDRDASDIMHETASVDATRDSLKRLTYRAAAVTARKAEVADATLTAGTYHEREPGEDAVSFERRERGTEWGSVVHDAIEKAAAGADGEHFRNIARGLLIAAERPSDANGEPVELDELVEIISTVQQSAIWKRAADAEVRLIEVPFGLRVDAHEYAQMIGARDIASGDTMSSTNYEAGEVPPIEIIDGRIDLVFRSSDGWTIVDYKSDAAGSRIPSTLMERYRGQIRLYSEAWKRLSGETPVGRVLLFTADGVAVEV
jgi:ATP-dependent exoDNAse (exonuclease V) beta subunit